MTPILIDLNRLKHSPYNGLYQFSKNLGQALSEVNPTDLSLYYYLPDNKVGMFGTHCNYIPHHSLHKYFMPSTQQFKVWHTATQISWYRPFNKKTKILFTIHDLNFLIEEKANSQRNKRLLAQIQKRIDRAHYISAISNYALQVAETHLNLGNLPRKVVYNGCSLAAFPLFSNVGYKPQKRFLFTIGTVQKRKNFHALMPLLVDNDYELIIAGENNFDYAETVMQAAVQYHVADRVKLIGAISEEEKYWYYANCDAFLFPSLAEGFGFPIIEAMLLGKPVFLSEETCLPEIGGTLAYYFNSFEDAAMQHTFACGMQHYQTNPMKEKIIAHASQFNWANTANNYIDIYKELAI